MATDVQLVNLALSRVGETQFLDSLEEASAAARNAKTVYVLQRQQLLEAFDWSFARAQVALARLSGEDVPGWLYAYALPDNCLVPRALAQADNLTPSSVPSCFGVPTFPVPWQRGLKADGSGQLLRANIESPVLTYTRSDVPVAVWPQLTCDALAWAMARELELSTPKKEGVGVQFAAMARQALQEAKAYDMNNGDRGPAAVPEMIRRRW